jgi:hypothetical protein
MTNIKEKCIEQIISLFEKYEDNDYITQRIHTHIVSYLPNTLENEMKNHEKRVSRNNYLTNEQQTFIQVFLSKHQYYYLHNNNLFYEYNGKNYFIVKEDDIIHKLLSSISKDRVLLDWKYKTKINIIKQIKERNLFNSIPESETIQNILNALYPSIFLSKNTAKYFLNVIGDNIFKKNTQLIFLVSASMKKLLVELDNIAFGAIGYTNTTHNFMTKYHENHNYENCRLIKINDSFSNDIWREILKKIGLDLLCVAAHYSKRYNNSDNFIENNSDEDLKSYTYYLKNNTPKNIVKEFCNNYIIVKQNSNNFIYDGNDTNTQTNANTQAKYKIEWKNINFIWKQFLSNNNYPNMMYSNSLKQLLKESFLYQEENDSFLNITCMHLPMQQEFIKFWEDTICIKTNNNNNNNDDTNVFEEELEIDEICSLYNFWYKQKNDEQVSSLYCSINEEKVLNIIQHFFPNIDIIDNKYIINLSCSLWDKIADINNSLNYIKEEIKKDYTLQLLSFDEAYNLYYKYCVTHSYKFIISKRFFEKYLYFKLNNYILHDKFININWIFE